MFPGFDDRRFATSGAEIRARVGGAGPPLLLLHGYPQTHIIWHKIAPALAERFTVVVTDLRGYGDSSKPPTTPDHAPYSKRAMALDQVEVMNALGFDRFAVVGHDRGGRVAHRLALDHEHRVERLDHRHLRTDVERQHLGIFLEVDRRHRAQRAELRALLGESDIVASTLPLTDATRGLMDTARPGAKEVIQRLRAHPLGERTHVVPLHGQQIRPIESRSVSGHVSIVSRQIAGGMPASGRHSTVIRR